MLVKSKGSIGRKTERHLVVKEERELEVGLLPLLLFMPPIRKPERKIDRQRLWLLLLQQQQGIKQIQEIERLVCKQLAYSRLNHTPNALSYSTLSLSLTNFGGERWVTIVLTAMGGKIIVIVGGLHTTAKLA